MKLASLRGYGVASREADDMGRQHLKLTGFIDHLKRDLEFSMKIRYLDSHGVINHFPSWAFLPTKGI